MNFQVSHAFLIMLAAVFLFTVVISRFLIPKLKSLKMGQKILDIGPRWHKSKEGTPTMGGITFIFAMLVTTALALVAEVAADEAWKGTLRAARVEGSAYTLSEAEFVKAANATVAANKAYYASDLEATTLTMTTEMGTEVGVGSVDANAEKVEFYDLAGRKVAKPANGIYVVNGKKVLVK